MTKLDETDAINIIARLRDYVRAGINPRILFNDAADLIEALCAELARMAAVSNLTVDAEDLRSAIRIIEGLISQQAMQDDWYVPELDRLKSVLAS